MSENEKLTEALQHYNEGVHELPPGWVAPFMPHPSREHRPAGGEVSPPTGTREADEARRQR
jgi:hypothetical protein